MLHCSNTQHWIQSRKKCRVFTVRAERCDGDQVWTDCGSETTRTCSDPDPDTSQDACVPRCHCPDDRPVWDDDRQICINADECVTYWKYVRLLSPSGSGVMRYLNLGVLSEIWCRALPLPFPFPSAVPAFPIHSKNGNFLKFLKSHIVVAHF